MSGCKLSTEQLDARRLKTIAATAPLMRGSLVREDGSVVDIADLVGAEKTVADPQLARAQTTFPYLRDTVIFRDGRTCTITSLIEAVLAKISDAGVVFSDELRLTYVPLGGDWSGSQSYRQRISKPYFT